MSGCASSTPFLSAACRQDHFGVNFADGRIRGHGLTADDHSDAVCN